MGLVWKVYIDDFNTREIKKHNVFDHGGFMKDLINIYNQYYDDFDRFSTAVRHSLMYHYWSKSEWEVIITSWPPYVNGNEVDRLTEEKTKRIVKYGNFVRESVNLDVEKKIDVYNQILMNWDHFINYLWNNRNLIKKGKR